MPAPASPLTEITAVAARITVAETTSVGKMTGAAKTAPAIAETAMSPAAAQPNKETC